MENEKFQVLMLDQFSKLINEVQSLREDVTQKIDSVTKEVNSIESRVINLENGIMKKIDAIYYDWRETQKQFNDEILENIQQLGTKIEALQMESTIVGVQPKPKKSIRRVMGALKPDFFPIDTTIE